MAKKKKSKKSGCGKKQTRKQRAASLRNLAKARKAKRKGKRKNKQFKRMPLVAAVQIARAMMGDNRRIKTRYFKIAKGLGAKEALRRIKKRAGRKFHGFTYSPGTGRAAII